MYRVQSNNICVLTTSCLLGNSSYTANAITETPLKALLMNRNNFMQLIGQSDILREFVFKSLSKRIGDFVLKLDEIIFLNLNDRLIRLLKLINNNSNEIRMTHQDLAIELGTQREVVSRLLKKLEKEEFLTIKRGMIILCDNSHR